MNDPFIQSGFTPTSDGSGNQAAAQSAPLTSKPEPTVEPPAAPIDPIGAAGKAQFSVNAQPEPVPAPQSSTETDLLKGILGGKFNKADELSAYITELEQKANREPENPFANNYIKSLNEAVRNGIDPEVFAQVASVDVENLSPKDALVLQLMWNDKLTKEDAELLVDSKYRLGTDENEESQEVKIARITAKTDANKAKEFLKAHQESSLTPPTEKIIAQQQEAWSKAYDQVTEPYKSIEIKGKSGSLNLPVSSESMQKANELVREIIDSGMFEVMPDQNGLEFARQIAYKEIIANELPNILDAISDYYKNQAITAQHNPRIPNGNSGTPPMPDSLAGVAEFLANQRGMKLQGN